MKFREPNASSSSSRDLETQQCPKGKGFTGFLVSHSDHKNASKHFPGNVRDTSDGDFLPKQRRLEGRKSENKRRKRGISFDLPADKQGVGPSQRRGILQSFTALWQWHLDYR